MGGVSVLSDNPAPADQDKLNFDRYLEPLVSILTNPKTESPFTIGIFGSWGSGKSTLLNMIDQRLKRDYPDKFVRVHFNPWIYRGEESMLVPLLHTLHDTLQQDVKERFVESAKKIGTVLLRLGADFLLRNITADVASLENLEKLEKSYLQERGMVQSEIRNLRTNLQAQADAVKDKGAQILFFIDDLDRCEPTQIIDVLESVKLFLDLRNIFIILAVDKEVIDRGIAIKYHKFKFSVDREGTIGAEYLEKMVQLPLPLFPLNRTQVRSFTKSLNPPAVVAKQLDLFGTLLLPNPRTIKRILNILAVTSAIIAASPDLATLNPDIVARLVVLQVQSGDLYAEVIKQPDFLLALEAFYEGSGTQQVLESFRKFGPRAAIFQKLAKSYHHPDSYLAKLFEGSPFEKIGKELPAYLTLLKGITS